MNRLKTKIKDFLSNAWDEIDYALRRLCGRPTPMKRFLTVLIIGSALAVANIYFVVSSIYSMGKHDAEIKFMELKHIESLKLQQKQDSINILNHKQYEYDKSR
jgi:hypothetical protein